MEIHDLAVHELARLLSKGEVSSVEAARAFLERIERLDKKIHAYITVSSEEAFVMAEAADRRLRNKDGVTPLTGVPISVKDIFCASGVRTTCASRMLENFVPVYDATVVKRLKDAGAVILGKNNMDEFAMGSSTENSAFFPTLNPWALDRVPGGSSGGSAASVSAGECAASVGTDTGGSIRQPASCCSVVGLKPTYGRVSRFGMIAFASSLDQAGPLTKDTEDAAIMLGAMAGLDPLDSTSLNAEVPDYGATLRGGVKGLKIGIPKEYFIEGIDGDVAEAVNAAMDTLERLGAVPVEISLPHTEFAVSVYYLVATAEASSNLARFDGVKYGFRAGDGKSLLDMYKLTRDRGFGPEVKRRIMLGTYSLSSGYYDAYYKKATEVRALITRDFDEAFGKCDVIVTPTAPTPAFKLGEKTKDPLTMYLSDIFTISCNLAGIPGISVPCGFTKDNLPVGLQILGRCLDEATVLKAAHAYEQATEWHKKRPAI